MMIGKIPTTSWFAVLLCLACGPGPERPTLALPPRPADAAGGAELAEGFRTLEVDAREDRIYAEVARGNVPTWLRELASVEMTGEVDGRTHRLTFWAMPDYLAVGGDDDYFFVPLSPRTAWRIADLVGASLPTPRMVDAVWSSARARLVPIRIPPDEHMWSMRYFERHNHLVQAQRRRSAREGVFVAGHKVDVVLPEAPVPDSQEVALYGWHLPDGTPVQPLYRVDMDSRPHFSMGVRLVHRHVLIDGAEHDLADLLRDPDLARLLAR